MFGDNHSQLMMVIKHRTRGFHRADVRESNEDSISIVDSVRKERTKKMSGVFDRPR